MSFHSIALTARASLIAALLVALPQWHLQAVEPEQPKPIPANRKQMLEALEQLKHRSPRLPMPPESASANVVPPAGLSSLGVVNNGRMRQFYLPAELQQHRPGVGPGQSQTTVPPGSSSPANGANQPPAIADMSYAFTTELFWIVSRVNNCHYCLGHQEAKLHQAGVQEPELLALDTDWSSFPAKQQAAFAFTRKLTHEPYRITDQDVDSLRQHFSDNQILAMTFLIGRYNSTNRWTDSLGIPQEDHREFKSSLSPTEIHSESQVTVTPAARPEADSFVAWQAELEKNGSRKARFAVKPAENMLPHETLLASIEGAGMFMWNNFARPRRWANCLRC